MTYKSDFLNEIESRGFIYQSSEIEDLDNLMSKKNITAYNFTCISNHYFFFAVQGEYQKLVE